MLTTAKADNKKSYFACAGDKRYDCGKNTLISHFQFLTGRRQLML